MLLQSLALLIKEETYESYNKTEERIRNPNSRTILTTSGLITRAFSLITLSVSTGISDHLRCENDYELRIWGFHDFTPEFDWGGGRAGTKHKHPQGFPRREPGTFRRDVPPGSLPLLCRVKIIKKITTVSQQRFHSRHTLKQRTDASNKQISRVLNIMRSVIATCLEET